MNTTPLTFAQFGNMITTARKAGHLYTSKTNLFGKRKTIKVGAKKSKYDNSTYPQENMVPNWIIIKKNQMTFKFNELDDQDSTLRKMLKTGKKHKQFFNKMSSMKYRKGFFKEFNKYYMVTNDATRNNFIIFKVNKPIDFPPVSAGMFYTKYGVLYSEEVQIFKDVLQNLVNT